MVTVREPYINKHKSSKYVNKFLELEN